MEFLYQLFIAPLQWFMHTVLQHAHTLTGSWPLSLILLSLVVSVVLLPLYHMAETWQEAERAVQARMAPKLAEFKAVFTGQERYMMIRTLYRQHGYHPVMALRTSMGFLIQVPFFFAAFQLLNRFSAFQGVSFGPIADLFAPDALLPLAGLHINLLPFIMTAANLLSAAVYTQRLTTKEKRQLWGIAALFLALLYNSSAALLIYWTCNNIFSLIKNIIYVRWVYADTRVRGQLPTAPRRHALGRAAPGWVSYACAAAGIVCFGLGELFRKRYGFASPLPVAVSLSACILLGMAAVCALRRLRRHDSYKQPDLTGVLLACALLACALVWGMTGAKKLVGTPSWQFYRLMACNTGLVTFWLLANRPLLPGLAALARGCAAHIAAPQRSPMFFGGCAVFAVLVFWYTPALIFASDPDFFFEPAAVLFASLTLRGFCFLAVCALILRVTHNDGRGILAACGALLGLLGCLYTFAAPGSYGGMDDFLLQDTRQLTSRTSILVDLLIIPFSAMALGFVLYKRKSAAVGRAFLGIVCVLSLAAGHTLYTAPPVTIMSAEEASAQLPDYTDAMFSFSRDKPNVVIILLDMFSGGHMPGMLRDEPQLASSLDGFTWYEDAMAPGGTTFLSIAAIMGGNKYTPAAINQRNVDSLLNEMHRAFALLPGFFAGKGFAVSLAEVDELKPELLYNECPDARGMTIVGKSIRTAYSAYWRKQHALPSPATESLAPFLAAMGVFRAAPWTVRGALYNEGAWMNSQNVRTNRSEGPNALLSLLPEISNADSARGTFKFMASQISHYPWQLDPDTCMPVDSKERTMDGRMVREHYYTERCALRKLSAWFAWMKDNDVYDNSYIIVLSDHDADSSPRIGKKFDSLRNGIIPWKPHALLLVKPPHSRGSLRINTTQPMSSADAAALICTELGPCPGLDDPDPLLLSAPARVRTHSSGLANPHRHEKDRFNVTDYEVTGSMFSKENWRKLPHEKK